MYSIYIHVYNHIIPYPIGIPKKVAKLTLPGTAPASCGVHGPRGEGELGGSPVSRRSRRQLGPVDDEFGDKKLIINQTHQPTHPKW